MVLHFNLYLCLSGQIEGLSRPWTNVCYYSQRFLLLNVIGATPLEPTLLYLSIDVYSHITQNVSFIIGAEQGLQNMCCTSSGLDMCLLTNMVLSFCSYFFTFGNIYQDNHPPDPDAYLCILDQFTLPYFAKVFVKRGNFHNASFEVQLVCFLQARFFFQYCI